MQSFTHWSGFYKLRNILLSLLHILPASFMAFMASRDAFNGFKFIAFRAKNIPVVVMINLSLILEWFCTNQIYLFIIGSITTIPMNLKHCASIYWFYGLLYRLYRLLVFSSRFAKIYCRMQKIHKHLWLMRQLHQLH